MQPAQTQKIALRAESKNHPGRHIGQDRLLPEGLPGVRVGDVDLHEGQGEPQEGIPEVRWTRG